MGANDITLGIKLTADGKGLVGEVKLSRDELDKLAGATRNANSEAARLNQQNKSLAASIRETTIEVAKYYAGYMSVAAASSSYRWALEQASHMQQLDARLKVATASQAEFAKAQQGVFEIANRYGVAVDETAKTFSRLNPVIAQLGGGSATTLKMIDGLAASLKLSGATAAESSAVLLQFSQAMGSGKVGGDEFRSMMENAEPLMRAVAKEMGKTTAELRQMSEDGRLTSSVFGNALLPAIDKLSKQAASIPLGIDQAWQTLKNNMSRDFGREFSANASATASAIKSLAGHTEELAAAAHAAEDGVIAVGKAGAMVAAGVLAAYMVKSSQALYEKVGAAIAARNATLAAAEAEAVAARIELERARTNQLWLAAERERAIATLASANATVTATQGVGVYSGALKYGREAAVEKSAALLHLADISRMQTIVTHDAAAAEAVLAAQAAASSTAMTGARTVIAALGGPIGAVITLLSVGATAWALFGESAKKSADTAAEAVNKIRAEAAKRGQDETATLTAERDRLKQIQAEAFREYNAAGSASDKSAVWKKYGMDKLSDQIVAFDAEIGAIQERTANLGKTTSERLSAAGEWSKLTENLKWREKIVKESNDKMLALQQSYVDRWNAASEKDRPGLEQDQQRALSAMLEARNKELASLPNHAKAIADYQNTLAAASAKAEKDGIDRSLRIIDDGLKDSLISYDAYYKARAALQLREIESEEARIRREIANEQQALANPKSDEDKYTALGKIAQLNADLTIQAQKRWDVEISGAREAGLANEKMGADVLAINAEILDATGKSGDAAVIRLAASYGKLIKEFEANGQHGAAERVRELFGLKYVDSVLKEISDKFNLEMSVLTDSEKRIQIDQQAGLLTEYEARQQLLELRRNEIPILEEILAKESRRSQMTDKQKAEFRALKLQLDSVKSGASELNRTFEYGARNAIGQYLDEATNTGRQTQTIFTDVFRGADTALANWVVHGKATFRDLLDTLKMDLAKFLAQRYVMAPIVGSFGGMIGTPGAAGAGGAVNSAMGNVFGNVATSAFSGFTPGALAASVEYGVAIGSESAAMIAAQEAGMATTTGMLSAIPGWGWALGAGLLLAGGSGLFGGGGGPKTEWYGGQNASAFPGHDGPNGLRDTNRSAQVDALAAAGVSGYASTVARFGGNAATMKLRLSGDSDPNGTAPDSVGYAMTLNGGQLYQGYQNFGKGEGQQHLPEIINRALLTAFQQTDMGPVANAIVVGLDPQTITTDLLNQTAAALSGAADLFGAPNSPLQTAIHAAQATSDGLATEFTKVGISGAVSAGSIRQAVSALDLTSAAGQQAARDMLALVGSVKTYETQLLGMIGFTRESLAGSLLDAMRNSPDAATAGEAFAQNIVSGIENVMLGDLAGQVSDIVTSGIITPALNALLTGQSVSEALSQANMDAVIQQATATATAFGQIWSDPDFIAAMEKIRATVSSTTATSLSGAPMSGAGGYQQAEKDAADSVTTAKSNLIDAYKRELDAQQQLADRMRGYVASLRNYRQSLLLGDLSPLGNRDKYDEARRQWDDISRRAALGDTAAIEQQQGAGQAFLEASRAYNASSEAYVRDFEAVRAGLARTESVAERQARIAADAAATARSQLDTLGDINRSVLTIPDAIRALAQALAQQAQLSEKDVNGKWTSTGGATANTSTGVISFKDGTSATIPYSQNWVDQQLAANDPMAVYNTAIAKGVSANSLDTMMGWSSGTSNTWALEHGLAAFAAGGIASSGLYLAGEDGPEIIEGIGATRVYPAEQTSALMSRISNPAANDALIGDIKELRRQVAAADLDRAHLAGLLERLIDAVDSGTAQTSGDLRDMKKHLSHVMSRMAA